MPATSRAKLAKAVREFGGYLTANAAAIANDDAERRRAGQAISTSFVDSAVNQVIGTRMVNKRQMRRCHRHLLLQIRTRVLKTPSPRTTGAVPGFTHTDRQDQTA